MTILYFVVGVLLSAAIATSIIEAKSKKKNKGVFIQEEFEIIERTCKRCNWNWVPRKEVTTVCPKCKSRYWDKEYTREVKKAKKRR